LWAPRLHPRPHPLCEPALGLALLFPDLPHPEHLEAMMVADMKAAGLDPALVYGFEKTGLLIPENDLAERGAAVEEYPRKHRRPEG
jgi:hypothetical protein